VTRVVGYARVSTADQRDRGVSLEAQWEKIEAYCQLRGFDLVERIEDAGVSGSIALAERRQGRRVAAALKEHDAAHVVALKLDRLFRDAGDALARTKAWDKAGIALHLCDMGGAAVDTSSPIGRMMLTMLAGFAEFERALIAERTTIALAHIKARGGRTGSVPYGMRLCDGWQELAAEDPRRKMLHPDLAEQAVIALVHELAGEAQPRRRAVRGTRKAICDELAERGYRARNGKPFVATQIGRMLASPASGPILLAA
jgi:site-specific DNA recombinase